MISSGENIDPVEIWGGSECSVVRVGNNVYDQLSRQGNEESTKDLELFAGLNIRTIRYPLLWEKYEADRNRFFSINDYRLDRLGELGIKPIAGLLHHGSGPFNTNLYDKEFPGLLSEFAFIMAERYPWLELYTPVNEPLTTARFSGLYGIWYPHKSDDYSFLRMFLNELRGTILSMKAVRSVNPDAKLIQTEDICKIHSVSSLKYQADFENERRWLTYDILLGKVNQGHPLWPYIINSGINEKDLEFFIENSISPYICGFNYYVTSERYLDNRKEVYPAGYLGGNGFEEYSDVEAVRANFSVDVNSGKLLREAWDRYKLPLALTEVHLACTREEQLRWFYEAYNNSTALKKEGIDIRAITAWSFLGSYDWNSLLCVKNDEYEPGVFDVRSGEPRPTALANLIRTIKHTDKGISSLLEVPGWWRRENRFIYKPENEKTEILRDKTDYSDISPLLIIGASGSLGSAFARICEGRGIVHYLTDKNEMDIASESSVRNIIETVKPWGIVNAAGFSRIDEAESSAFTCFRENTIGPVILAETCRAMNIRLVTFSSDQVFNGKKKRPYTETDCTNPINLYGLSKRIAEEKIMKVNRGALIIRTSTFFNPWHMEDNLVKIMQSSLYSEQQFYLASDIISSPAYIPDLVHAVLDLLIDGDWGIWHLSSQEEISWFDFAVKALRIAGLNESVVSPVPSSKMNYLAMRPQYSVLRSTGGITLPPLTTSLTNFIAEFLREPAYQPISQSSY